MESLRRAATNGKSGARDRRRVRIHDDEKAGSLTTALCLALVGAVIYLVADMVLR